MGATHGTWVCSAAGAHDAGEEGAAPRAAKKLKGASGTARAEPHVSAAAGGCEEGAAESEGVQGGHGAADVLGFVGGAGLGGGGGGGDDAEPHRSLEERAAALRQEALQLLEASFRVGEQGT
jgi:hypothetical protein